MPEKIKKALLRRKEIEKRTTLSRVTIYERVRRGTFPRPIKLGARSSAWYEHEVSQWLDDPEGYRAPAQEAVPATTVEQGAK